MKIKPWQCWLNASRFGGYKRPNKGFSLIEMLLVLALISVAITYQLRDVQRTTDALANTRIAAHQREVSRAAKNYIKANWAAILASATSSVPAVITVQQLVTANFLPSGFSTTNVAAQTACVQVLQPTAGSLNAVVLTEGAALQRGRMIDVALQLGAEGGYVDPDQASPLRALGAARTFDFALTAFTTTSCSGTPVAAGNLVSRLFFSDVALPPPYLYNVPVAGQPGANTMTTNLNMGGNDITNINTISLTGNVRSPCLVDPVQPTFLVCPAGNSSINTLTANTITASKMTDLDNPLYVVDPSSTSVFKDAVITDRSVNLSLKDMLPNVVMFDDGELTLTGTAAIVAAPVCKTTSLQRIFLSVRKTQMDLDGVSVALHVDATPLGGNGWLVGTFDSRGNPVNQGVIAWQTGCNNKGL
jgi:prepilin-type N-terminal cleavage/methylation domain-containing protein